MLGNLITDQLKNKKLKLASHLKKIKKITAKCIAIFQGDKDLQKWNKELLQVKNTIIRLQDQLAN